MNVQTETADGVATVRFGDPERLTVLSVDLADELSRAMSDLAAEPIVRCIVLTGAGTAFAAGADVVALRAGTTDDAMAFNRRLVSLNDQVAAMPVPVICALNGHAFGGGLELALACTVRLADARAKLGLPEIKVGILPGSGGMLRLPQVVRPGVVLDLLLSGRSVGADEAASLGLIDEVVTAGQVLERALERARDVAAAPPLAVRSILAVSRQVEQLSQDAGTTLVEEHLRTLLETEDAEEGFTAFRERRAPRFRGR